MKTIQKRAADLAQGDVMVGAPGVGKMSRAIVLRVLPGCPGEHAAHVVVDYWACNTGRVVAGAAFEADGIIEVEARDVRPEPPSARELAVALDALANYDHRKLTRTCWESNLRLAREIVERARRAGLIP
jgi:hypothetical protein